MDTVTISSAQSIALEDLKSLLANRWSIKQGRDPNRLIIEASGTHVYVYYATQEDGTPDPRRVWLDYHSVALVKEIITVIGDNPNLLIENDYGTSLPGDQFVARLRSEPGWEWRV